MDSKGSIVGVLGWVPRVNGGIPILKVLRGARPPTQTKLNKLGITVLCIWHSTLSSPWLRKMIYPTSFSEVIQLFEVAKVLARSFILVLTATALPMILTSLKYRTHLSARLLIDKLQMRAVRPYK